jgi:hypothetical protein
VSEPDHEPTDVAARPAGGLRPHVPEHRPQAAGPPPRPQVTTQLAPPGRPARPRSPWALQLSAAAWILSAAAGGGGIAAALLDGDALRRKLTTEAAAADPGLAADAVQDGVAVTTAVVLGSVAVVSLLAVVGTAVLLRRRPAARWLLLLTGALTLVADDVAQSVVSGGSDVDRIAFVAQAGLVVVALVALFWRSTGRWLRLRSG